MGKKARLFLMLLFAVFVCVGVDNARCTMTAMSGGRAVLLRRARRTVRTMIYVRGTDDEIEQQLTDAYADCIQGAYRVVGVMREQPGGTDVWHEANRMLRNGQIDLIVVSSGAVVPGVLESATGGIPGPRARLLAADAVRSTRHRRIRPTRRGDGGA